MRAGDTVRVEMGECVGRQTLDLVIKSTPDRATIERMAKCGITELSRG